MQNLHTLIVISLKNYRLNIRSTELIFRLHNWFFCVRDRGLTGFIARKVDRQSYGHLHFTHLYWVIFVANPGRVPQLYT